MEERYRKRGRQGNKAMNSQKSVRFLVALCRSALLGRATEHKRPMSQRRKPMQVNPSRDKGASPPSLGADVQKNEASTQWPITCSVRLPPDGSWCISMRDSQVATGSSSGSVPYARQGVQLDLSERFLSRHRWGLAEAPVQRQRTKSHNSWGAERRLLFGKGPCMHRPPARASLFTTFTRPLLFCCRLTQPSVIGGNLIQDATYA